MARKVKYDWEAIKQSYADGITVNELAKSYGVAKKTLQNRISAEKWELHGALNSQVDEFRESLGKISRNVENDPIKQQIVTERLNTIIEDNDIISGNRKLAKAFQGLMGRGIQSGIYKTPQDIKAGASTIRELESVANPSSSKIEVNNTNAQQNNKSIKVTYE